MAWLTLPDVVFYSRPNTDRKVPRLRLGALSDSRVDDMIADGLLSHERLEEFADLAAGNLSEHRRADMMARGEHGSHVWCFDPRPDGSGPLDLHSDECRMRTLLAHIDALQRENDLLLIQYKLVRHALDWAEGQ